MSGRKNENYKRSSWQKNGAKMETFECEKQIGESGISGSYQSRGMIGSFPKGFNKDDLKDFQLQDTFTGKDNSLHRKTSGKSLGKKDKNPDTQKRTNPSQNKDFKYVRPLNNHEEGKTEYSGEVEDLRTGEKKSVIGFSSGPCWNIAGNDPEQMERVSSILQKTCSDASSESEVSSESSEDW